MGYVVVGLSDNDNLPNLSQACGGNATGAELGKISFQCDIKLFLKRSKTLILLVFSIKFAQRNGTIPALFNLQTIFISFDTSISFSQGEGKC